MPRPVPQVLKSLLATLVLLVCFGNASAQTLYCPLQYIGEFEGVELADQYEIAKQFTGSDVSTFSRTNVYVTVKEKVLYLQTNFRPAEGEYPLKLATKDFGQDLKFYLKDLLEQFEQSTSGFDRAYADEMTIYVDQKLFTNPKYKSLGLSNARKLSLIDEHGLA
ncbi:MAG TPA: hypothetical protein VGV59_05715, partial [Pyrinomonadaceae bacterium]|nr:hypothetical protein [Pyrinomonadaceae bacterium]